MRLVLDTNSVISGILWRGSAHAILDLARIRRIKIFTTEWLVSELTFTFSKAKFAKPFQRLGASTNTAVTDYLQTAHLIRKPQAIQPVCRDPSDDEVLACALAAHADLIVSGDKDLLVLGHYGNSTIVTSSVGLAMITSTIGP